MSEDDYKEVFILHSPDCVQIHCQVKERREVELNVTEIAGQEIADGEVNYSFSKTPLAYFSTRHCVHEQRELSCPKLAQVARRICRYYSQSDCLKLRI